MPNASPPSPDRDRPRVDVRSLSLAQLQRLAVHGSQRARTELDRRMNAPSDTAAPDADTPHAPLTEQLELVAHQSAEHDPADGVPRLVGMVLIAWGVLLLFGALVMLSRGGGPFYVFFALGIVAVGWLLMRCSRWAIALHGTLLPAVLLWAWLHTHGRLGLALFEALPLLISALWMAVPPVREPLE
jgi:hypothetical protein